jgi:transposase
MKDIVPVRIRQKIINRYFDGSGQTYQSVADQFGVGVATVNRLFRLYRETKSVAPRRRGGNRKRRINEEWLLAHVAAHPDARLIDRARDFEQEFGEPVAAPVVWLALQRLGITHKKKRSTRPKKTVLV